MRFQIIGIALENFLGFRNRVANATGAGINLCQRRTQVLRSRVRFDGHAVFLDGLGHQVAAPVNRHLLFVHVSHGEVIVSSGFIGFVRS